MKFHELLTAWMADTLDLESEIKFYKFVINGQPLIKKNSKEICRNRHTGKMFIKGSDRYVSGKDEAMWQLVQQKQTHKKDGVEFPFGEVTVGYKFYLGDRRPRDLDNLFGAPNDFLQATGIIQNDAMIISYLPPIKIYEKNVWRTEITVVTGVKLK